MMKNIVIKLVVVAGLLVGTMAVFEVVQPPAPAEAATSCNWYSWGVTCTETKVVSRNCPKTVYEPLIVPVSTAVWTWVAKVSKWVAPSISGWATVMRAATKWYACNYVVTRSCTNTQRIMCTP